MKRKTGDDDAAPTVDSELAGSKKRQRLSDEDTSPKVAKKINKEKSKKKDRKDNNDKNDKSEKKAKKSKKATKSEEDVKIEVDAEAVQPAQETSQDQPMKNADDEAVAIEAQSAVKKKKSKKNKTKKDPKSETTTVKAESSADEPTKATKGQHGDNATAENKSNKKTRFIVFVGNLPYSAKVADIEKHFNAVRPTSIRLLHQKNDPTKSRGIAFVEFAGYDTMKTCLKKMHHTTMTCMGVDHRGRPKEEERQINVELTAGGGGNTQHRKEKIKEKNEKLKGERERRAIEEEKAKVKKETERLTKEGEKKGGQDGIHPSRKAIMAKIS
ncbi:uncharacterized protein BCR38DRAFT_441321 [Pseudomassariella vexata]|uniref:RRM domain-containing protein n=1 Tax=Pseudomassariella vexata TaxID=1141098 RepID=A0A1Y2DPD6_9PEZI|nr:uncharacterized protein BCR38DRAFT_441321 [Pseudomassariella vexata]ORY60515.1 hypothetical protein BCR38DRAFT_441321 [Pseudomassariella vexata]